MKYMNIIKLLSILLCIGMMFVACDNTKEDDSTTVDAERVEAENATEEALIENVEAKFENFFEISKEEIKKLNTATRIDGDVVSATEDLYVLKKTDVDTKNTVTEKFSIYNVRSGKVILNFENKYFHGAYNTFDWNDINIKDENVKYPESVMDVQAKEAAFVLYDEYGMQMLKQYSIPYIVVRSARITEIDKETRENNPDGCIYKIETKYEYYDISGKLITSSNSEIDVNQTELNIISFGSVKVMFNEETFALRHVYNSENEVLDRAFDAENERFGYYGLESERISNFGYAYYIDVFDKAVEKTSRYYLNAKYEDVGIFYLNNGDILCQYTQEVNEGEPYEFFYIDANGEKHYMALAHSVIDVRDGAEKEIELSYLIESMTTGERFAEKNELGGNKIDVSKNARNVAHARKIEKKLLCDRNVFVFDNDMKLLFELERIVPEHVVELDGAFGFTVLDNGDYLVEINDIVSDRAIVKADGTVRTYLKNGMEIYGEFIIYDNVIYDYDLNILKDLNETYYVVEGVIFGELVLRNTEISANLYNTKYWTVDEEGYMHSWIGGNITIDEVGDDYLIVRNDDDGKYTLYNSSYNEILTTYDIMYVYEFGGEYVVVTEIAGHAVLYRIS